MSRYLFALLLSTTVWANLDLITYSEDVHFRDTCAQASFMTFTVNGDDFPDASEQNPYYLRLRLMQASFGVRFGQTLVDVETAPPPLNRPIYLALTGTWSSSEVVVADPTAIAIVRWRAGEKAIWLRITQSSGEWIQDAQGNPVSPDSDRRIHFSFGMAASEIWDLNAARYPDYANLPANTRWPAEMLDPINDSRGWAISTIACLNLSESDLPPMPSFLSEIKVDFLIYDAQTSGVTTAVDPDDIVFGSSFPSFFLINVIARGYDLSCSPNLDITTGNSILLCPENVAVPPDLVPLDLVINEPTACDYNWGSYISLTVPNPTDVAFLIAEDSSGQPVPIVGLPTTFEVLGFSGFFGTVPITALAQENELFYENGHWMSKNIRLVALQPASGPILVTGQVYGRALGVGQGQLEASLWHSFHDDPLDDFPFDGTLDDGDPGTGVRDIDQAVACLGEPSLSYEFPSTQLPFIVCSQAVPALGNWGRLVLVLGLMTIVGLMARSRGRET